MDLCNGLSGSEATEYSRYARLFFCFAFGRSLTASSYRRLAWVFQFSNKAHVRRYFMDAIPKGKQDDLSVPAVQAVQYYDKLFMHERYCKEHGYTFEQGKEYRCKRFRPVIDSFFDWLEKQHPVVNTRFDQAVKYGPKPETVPVYLWKTSGAACRTI